MTHTQMSEYLHRLMADFFHKSKGDRMIVKQYPNGIRMSNQKIISSDHYGKIKFDTGRETVWIFTQLPNRTRDNIARLHETESGELEFTDIAIEKYLNALPRPK